MQHDYTCAFERAAIRARSAARRIAALVEGAAVELELVASSPEFPLLTNELNVVVGSGTLEVAGTASAAVGVAVRELPGLTHCSFAVLPMGEEDLSRLGGLPVLALFTLGRQAEVLGETACTAAGLRVIRALALLTLGKVAVTSSEPASASGMVCEALEVPAVVTLSLGNVAVTTPEASKKPFFTAL